MLQTTRAKSETDAISKVTKKARPVTNLTTGAASLTADAVINGIVNQSGAQGAHNKTLPTAALLVAAMNDPAVGDTFEFTLVNDQGGATITLVTAEGLTLVGLMTVIATEARTFVGRVTNVGTPAVTFYRS